MDNSYSFDKKCIERGKELLSEKRPLFSIGEEEWMRIINLLREEYFTIERVEQRTELIYRSEQYVEVPYSVNS